jgi:hypothetical protein
MHCDHFLICCAPHLLYSASSPVPLTKYMVFLVGSIKIGQVVKLLESDRHMHVDMMIP